MLGDTINNAARLSDFARDDPLWITKSMLGKLPPEDRDLVRYGIRRHDTKGREMLVPSTFSRISELVNLEYPRHRKLNDIAALPVTEIFDVTGKNKRGGAAS